MQTDGNLVLYAPGGAPLWNTITWGHPGASLSLQDDCNVVVYDGNGRPLWDAGTWRACAAPPPNPCGALIEGWLCRSIDCNDATVFSGYSPSRQDLQNPIGTVRRGEWYQTNIVDGKATRIKWNGRDGYILRYCLDGSCCPNP